MKVIVLDEPGGTENLRPAELPKPQPGSGEVLIRTNSLSINPVDIKTRKGGALYGKMKEEGAVILGWDVSGTVEAVGPGASRFRPGDEVFGMVNFPGHGKAYAEYVSAPEAHLALKPVNISHEEAAAATLAALTAWQVLLQQAGLKEGQQVLIHAAAGGVGHFAIQIARHFGATVAGTASAANDAFIRELGADIHIDYHRPEAFDSLPLFDIVLDPIGGENTLRSVGLARPGGHVISIVGGVKEEVQKAAAEKGVHAANYLVHSSGEDMEALAGLLASGKLNSHVSQRFSFEDMAAAHAQIETGRTRGKIVVNL